MENPVAELSSAAAAAAAADGNAASDVEAGAVDESRDAEIEVSELTAMEGLLISCCFA